MEQWRKVEGFEQYEVSNTGKIRRKKNTGEYVPLTTDTVQLGADRRNRFRTQRLVWQAFNGEIPAGRIIRRIDTNRPPSIDNIMIAEKAQRREPKTKSIISLREQGLSYSKIAQQLSTTVSNVSKCLSRNAPHLLHNTIKQSLNGQ